MKFVTPVLKHVVYPALAGIGYFRRLAPDGPAVLTYHGVFPDNYRRLDSFLDGNLIATGSLRRQLQLLKAHYNVISPEEFLSWCRSREPLPPRSVLLTCDDGLENVLTSMLPLLHEQQLSCLFFITGASLSDKLSMLWYEELYLILRDGPEVSDLELPEIDIRVRVSGHLEKRCLWRNLVKKFSQVDQRKRAILLQQVRIRLGLPERWNSAYMTDPVSRGRFCMLTLPELRELVDHGMSIGAHTLSHPMLSQQPSELLWEEISESRRALEQSLNCNIWALAYPFGDSASVGERELEMARRAGFECAFLNIEKSTRIESFFAFPRIHVTAEMALSEFEAHISGFFRSARGLFVRPPKLLNSGLVRSE
jgi:peptidoglycan/xylan/chitin deacetylase (PgdA/CDA1 family)